MPQIDVDVNFKDLDNLSNAHQAVVADFLMMRKDLGAFVAGFTYFYNQMPNTYAIRFTQVIELVASAKFPGRYHCFIVDNILGEGGYGKVRKSAVKVTLLPDPNKHGHFLLSKPKSQTRAIKYPHLESYHRSYKEASGEVIAEAGFMGMLAPVRPHHRIPAGKSHSDTFLPRIIEPCYPGEDLLTLSQRNDLKPESYSLQAKLDISISLLAKLMFMQQWFFHRDLNHKNMIVDMVNREVNFVDYAWAVDINKFVKVEGDTYGTYYFVAPEQYDDKNYKYPDAIDTFSAGIIIAELFTTDDKLRQEVISSYLDQVCRDLYGNWGSDQDPYKNNYLKTLYREKPAFPSFLSYVRDYLLNDYGTDVFVWNNIDASFALSVAGVVGQEIVSKFQGEPEGYNIPYKNELNDSQREELTEIIMGLVETEPSARSTASGALKKFIQFYLNKYPDDIEDLKQRIQKQLLMAAVDAAIQKLKGEVYKIPFDAVPQEEKSKIACLRGILEKLKQFREGLRKSSAVQPSSQVSTCSSNESPAPVTTIKVHRQEVMDCLKELPTQSSSLSKFISGIFSSGNNPLRVAEQALQIIKNANCMADEIFASVPSPRPRITIDFTNLTDLSKSDQSIVADFLMWQKDDGAYAADCPYYFPQRPITYAIRFRQPVELVASVKEPGLYHCFIVDETLGKGGFATVFKSTRKVTISPDLNHPKHYKFKDPKPQARAIKYPKLNRYDMSYAEASKAAVAEVRHMAMVAPARLHDRIPAGKSHSVTFVPRVIMPCYPGEDLYALSKREDLAAEFYSLKTKCELAICLLAKLMFLQKLGIIHFDLKNLNMIVDMQNREINFVDFGFAKEINNLRRGKDSIGGSPRYTAPERFAPEPGEYTIAVDTFSVGIVIAELFVTDQKLRDDVLSPLFLCCCDYLYKQQNSEEYEKDYFLGIFRSLLLSKHHVDVYKWNGLLEQSLGEVVGPNVISAVLPKNSNTESRQYTIPYESELDKPQRQELTETIMGLVNHDPVKRTTASEALNKFILFYQKKYPDDHETLKYRTQKQLLMAAVDAAIQKLKGEVYKKTSDHASVANSEKILTKLKEFRKEQRKSSSIQPSTQGSACSSSDSLVSAKTIKDLREEVIAFFTVDCNGVSAPHGFNDKATQKATSSTNGFFSQSSKPLEIGAQALKLIKDANRMADEIFANIPALRSQFSH